MLKILILTVLLTMANFSVGAAEFMKVGLAETQATNGKIYLIDIRRPDEWKRSGVAKPAHKISMHQEGFLERLSNLTNGKKDAPIALICATGMRSTWLAGELEKRGYTNVINVREGMMGSKFGPGWLKRGLPVRAGG